MAFLFQRTNPDDEDHAEIADEQEERAGNARDAEAAVSDSVGQAEDAGAQHALGEVERRARERRAAQALAAVHGNGGGVGGLVPRRLDDQIGRFAVARRRQWLRTHRACAAAAAHVR